MSVSHSPSSLETLSGALSEIVRTTASSVVTIRSPRARSSAFVWRRNLAVTADEALGEDGEISVALPDGETVQAQLVGRDPTTDVALLRIEPLALEPVALQARPVMAGALAAVIGAEDGQRTAALGIVSLAGPAWQSLRGGEIDARIELDASVRRSAEGGLVVDSAGRPFGMVAFGPRRRVLVIPAATIDRVAAQLETQGRVPRGYLGLGLQPVRLDDGGLGAMVMNVEPKGPGAAAGMQQGDVIVAWNGSPISGVQTFARVLGPRTVASVVTLSIRRGGDKVELPLTIGERPHA